MMKRTGLSILFILISTGLALAQAEFSVGGYVKYLPSQTWVNTSILPPIFQDALPTSFDDHLIHNRLNFLLESDYSAGPPWWRVELGMRNRVFYGYQAGTDAFKDQLEVDPGIIDMRWLWNKEGDVLFHTEIDRLNFAYETNAFAIHIGRQRINWGIHNVFNPNDIFNQYNYFDFDYEERPGVDAVHFQYNLGDGFSSIELAYSPNLDNSKMSKAAALYRTNWKGYDWQVLAGYTEYDVVLGGGWAGSIGGFGFKGELAYYSSTDENESTSNFTQTIGFDYAFANSAYVSAAYLYNESGAVNPTILDQLSLRETRLSSKNIFPYRHTLMLNATYPITMLWSVNVTWFQSHNLDQAAFVPGISYSISNNWDAMLLAQLFSARDMDENIALFNSALYARVKWSF